MSTSIEETKDPVKSGENQETRDDRGRFKPGFSGNPTGAGAGRPRGKSLKQYDRERFECMSDEEKEEFLSRIAPDVRYRMAEGNPATESNIGNKDGKPFVVNIVKEIAQQNDIDSSSSEDSIRQTPIQSSELREEIREDNPSD